MIELDGEGPANYPQESTAKNIAVMERRRSIRENIEDRIQRHRDAIIKLEKVRDTLQTGNILDVCMDDLQQAMRW